MYNTIHKTYNILKDILYKTDTRKYISTCLYDTNINIISLLNAMGNIRKHD